MVEKQAFDDLQADARRLTEVVSDQVHKLGHGIQTRKAVDVFGHVGHQTEALRFSADETTFQSHRRRAAVREQSLASILLDVFALSAARAISVLMSWVMTVIRYLWKFWSANVFVLALLGLSLATNLVYSSRDTSAWWTERNAAKFMSRLGVAPDTVMRRSIPLDVIDSLVTAQPDGLEGRESQW